MSYFRRDERNIREYVVNPVLINFENGKFGVRVGTWLTGYKFLTESSTTTAKLQGEVERFCMFDLNEAKRVLINLKEIDKQTRKNYQEDLKLRNKAFREKMRRLRKVKNYTVVGVVRED